MPSPATEGNTWPTRPAAENMTVRSSRRSRWPKPRSVNHQRMPPRIWIRRNETNAIARPGFEARARLARTPPRSTRETMKATMIAETAPLATRAATPQRGLGVSCIAKPQPPAKSVASRPAQMLIVRRMVNGINGLTGYQFNRRMPAHHVCVEIRNRPSRTGRRRRSTVPSSSHTARRTGAKPIGRPGSAAGGWPHRMPPPKNGSLKRLGR